MVRAAYRLADNATAEQIAADAADRAVDHIETPYIPLEVHAVSGIDAFRANGPVAVVERLYQQWLERTDRLAKDSQDHFFRTQSLAAAERQMRSGVDQVPQ